MDQPVPSEDPVIDEAQRDQLAREREARLARLDALGGTMMRKAQEQVSARRVVETRWLEDIRQFNGVYSADVENRLKESEKSRVFLGLTRSKTNIAESRVADMLFPTDDRNWEISPTPVPDLSEPGKEDSTLATDQNGQQVVSDETGEPLTAAEVAAAVREDAKARASEMQREIDDQLNEASYSNKAREAIHQGVLLGTGVLKGPAVVGRVRNRWVRTENGWVAEQVKDLRPWVEWVDVWNFFPDSSALRMEDAEFAFERDYKTKRQVMELRNNPYYVQENVERLIESKPLASHIGAGHIAELRQIHGGTTTLEDNRYEVWAYHGPIKVSDLVDCGCGDDLPPDTSLDDELYGCIEVSGNLVIKAYLDPLDGAELPYSIYVYERDETSIFGFGVPYQMRDPQRVANAAWRMLLDNLGLSVSPQTVINRKLVEPANGRWGLTPGKLWYLKDDTRSVNDVFGQFAIDPRQAEMTALLKDAMQLADETTNLPLIAQGQQTPLTKTAQGMAMLMNAANTVLRRSVKEWDDGITRPLISRFYQWNMQHGQREEIKGDYEVDARGASVLLAKEIQANNLMVLGANFGQSPVFGPMMKPAPLLRKIIQSHHLSADELVLSDKELEAVQAQQAEAAQAGQGTDPRVQAEQMRAENRMAELAFERETKQQINEAERELALLKLATDRDMSVEKLRTMLATTQMKIEGDMAKQTQEVRVKAQFGSGL